MLSIKLIMSSAEKNLLEFLAISLSLASKNYISQFNNLSLRTGATLLESKLLYSMLRINSWNLRIAFSSLVNEAMFLNCYGTVSDVLYLAQS